MATLFGQIVYVGSKRSRRAWGTLTVNLHQLKIYSKRSDGSVRLMRATGLQRTSSGKPSSKFRAECRAYCEAQGYALVVDPSTVISREYVYPVVGV